MSESLVSTVLPICLTPAVGSYFFGYYDKSPWCPLGQRVLACRAPFEDRPPSSEDVLELGVIDLAGGATFEPFALTRAWNWQQGCMLQWLDADRVLFNDRRDGRFVAVVADLSSGKQLQLPRPVYAVAPGGKVAVSLSFARLHRLRPGYGYAGVLEGNSHVDAPADDGLWMMDLASGDASLIYSVAQARREFGGITAGVGQHWFNHAQFAPSGRRLAFMHRWQLDQGAAWATRLVTIDADGRSPFSLVHAGMCSHYDWRDDEHLLAYSRVNEAGKPRDAFHLLTDRTNESVPLAPDELNSDGHCSYSPDRKWILNDTYPDTTDGCRRLMLIRAADSRVIEIGRFFGPLPDQVEVRCDLHPRWSRDGRQVCIDSVHEGRRAMYAIDVSQIVNAGAI